MSRVSASPRLAWALFETPLGNMGVLWGEGGIVRLHFPEETDEATTRRLLSGKKNTERGEPPSWLRVALAKIKAQLEGKPQDLMGVPLALAALPPFHARVYQAARTIGPGRTASYGELAALAGSPLAARAVGQAMAKNPFAVVVPCHRILAAGRKPGGFGAFGGLETKRRLLALEGVRLGERQASLFGGDGGLGFEPGVALAALSKADPKLGRVFERIGPFRLRLEELHSPFESLAEAIVYQQLTGKAAATILSRVKALYGKKPFPSPDDVLGSPDDSLRGAGLSRAKTAALKDLAAKTKDGTVPSLAELSRLGDDEVVLRLTEIRGIGRWTVEMLLIFRLGRPDVLPATDFGIRKGFARAFGKKDGELPSPKDVLRRGERWRPFRTVASWYLWRASELRT